MKAYEFPVKITPDKRIELPDAFMKLLPDTGVVRVIILINESVDENEDAAWSRFAAEQFLKGYADVDAIYDQL
jgi:hypothetical protein